MVQYIVELAQEVARYAEEGELGEVLNLRAGLAEELDRLDPRDFLPSARYEFVVTRLQVRRLANRTGASSGMLPDVLALARRVVGVLAEYGGEGSRASRRSFSFIMDLGLRQIIERDFRELTLNVFPSGSWKSTVVLAGSILEAILYDQLADPATKPKALASSKAPRDKSGTAKDLDAGEWTLMQMIEVSTDINLLPQDRAKSIDQILRDYRNYVHPKKELRSKYPCTEAEAMMALGALEAVCNVLTPPSQNTI